jgi:hypothetical protein
MFFSGPGVYYYWSSKTARRHIDTQDYCPGNNQLTGASYFKNPILGKFVTLITRIKNRKYLLV